MQIGRSIMGFFKPQEASPNAALTLMMSTSRRAKLAAGIPECAHAPTELLARFAREAVAATGADQGRDKTPEDGGVKAGGDTLYAATGFIPTEHRADLLAVIGWTRWIDGKGTEASKFMSLALVSQPRPPAQPTTQPTSQPADSRAPHGRQRRRQALTKMTTVMALVIHCG